MTAITLWLPSIFTHLFEHRRLTSFMRNLYNQATSSSITSPLVNVLSACIYDLKFFTALCSLSVATTLHF